MYKLKHAYAFTGFLGLLTLNCPYKADVFLTLIYQLKFYTYFRIVQQNQN